MKETTPSVQNGDLSRRLTVLKIPDHHVEYYGVLKIEKTPQTSKKNQRAWACAPRNFMQTRGSVHFSTFLELSGTHLSNAPGETTAPNILHSRGGGTAR